LKNKDDAGLIALAGIKSQYISRESSGRREESARRVDFIGTYSGFWRANRHAV
jgi:hypothetical protein